MRVAGTDRRESGAVHIVALLIVFAVLILVYVSLADTPKKKSSASRAAARTQPPTTTTVPLPTINADAVASAVGPAVVGIDATLADGAHTYATGMVLTPAGEILTNNHAIAGSTAIAVHLGDGRTFAATVRGYDVAHDVAVLGLAGAAGLPTVNLADGPIVGAPVVALGRVAVTNELTRPMGSVTAVHRNVQAGDANDPDGIETLPDLAQVAVPTRPSDSGGPVVDAHGRVIAMRTAASAGRLFQGQTANMTYAIPVEAILRVADRVDAGQGNETVHVGPTATLGLTVLSEADGSSISRVARVQPDSPATGAHIAPNAVLVSVDDVTVGSAADLDGVLANHRPGDTVTVDWADAKGEFHTRAIRLASGPPA